MEAPLRIALVVYGLAKHAGGLSMYVCNFTKALCDAGHEVTVIATNAGPHGTSGDVIVGLDPRVTLQFFIVDSWFQRRIYRSISLRRWLETNIDRFDVVDIQGIWSFVTVDAATICIKRGKPYVVTPHGNMASWDWDKRPLAKRIFYAWFLKEPWRRAAVVRFLSDEELAACRIAPSAGTAVIPNAVDSGALRAERAETGLRERLGLGRSVPIISFVGRVTEQKGVLEMLDAFDEFADGHPSSVLIVAGPHDSGYGSAVEKRIGRMRNGSRVRIIGPIYDLDRNELLAESTVFVTLSKNEGLPIAVLEALACGVPVVITERTNLPKVAEWNAGFIVPEAGARDLVVDALRQVVGRGGGATSPLSLNARGMIEREYSWAATLPRILGLYRRITEGLRG